MALVDTGASAHIFIDISFAHSQNLFTQKLQNPRTLQLADGSPAPAGAVYEKAILDFKLLQHTERASGFLTKLNPAVPIILGLEWLRLHDPSISWAKNTLTFNSNFCRHHCLQDGHPITVTGLTKEGEQALRQPNLAQIHMTKPLPEKGTDDEPSKSIRGKAAPDVSMSKDKGQAPSPGTIPGTVPSEGTKKKKVPRLPAKVVGGVRSPRRTQNRHSRSPPDEKSPNPENQEELESLDIRFIGAAPFAHLAKKKENRISRIDLRHLSSHKAPSEQDLHKLDELKEQDFKKLLQGESSYEDNDGGTFIWEEVLILYVAELLVLLLNSYPTDSRTPRVATLRE